MKKYDVYPFHVEVVSAKQLVKNLEPEFESKSVLRVCYPKLTGKQRNFDALESRTRRAQSLIDLCLKGLSLVPPVLLKDPCHFWDGVEDAWIPWAFREFEEGRLLVKDELADSPETVLSGEMDKGLVNFVMLTQVRIVYPFESYLSQNNTHRSERIKSVFKRVFSYDS